MAQVYVNTLMLQDFLGEPEWAELLTPADRRGLTPLFWSHVRPYGEVNLDMDTRLDLDAVKLPGPRAVLLRTHQQSAHYFVNVTSVRRGPPSSANSRTQLPPTPTRSKRRPCATPNWKRTPGNSGLRSTRRTVERFARCGSRGEPAAWRLRVSEGLANVMPS
ncbi:transposase [Streptomyces sp. SID12488]|nr:transposase [Streptomyces sp. SID12488]